MEMAGSDKYTPNHTMTYLKDGQECSESSGFDQIKFVFEVPEESSARDIDIDVSSDQLKLNSSNYEF